MTGRLLRRCSPRGQRGAIAVVMAIVIVGLAVPLVGVATTTYLRSGLAAEMQRAADAGATAGATRIPLADPSTLRNVLTTLTPGQSVTGQIVNAMTSPCTSSTPYSASTTCPLSIAQQVCLNSLAQDDRFQAWSTKFGPPSCVASYSDDTGFVANLSNCVTATTNSLFQGVAPLPTSTLTTLLSGLTSQIFGLVSGTSVLGLATLLPALMTPGITVSVTWKQSGPFDALIPTGTGTIVRSATAVRHFKNLLVVPTLGSSQTVNIPIVGGLLGGVIGYLGIAVTNAPNLSVGQVQNVNLANVNPALSQVSQILTASLNTTNGVVWTGTGLGSVLPTSCQNVLPSMTSDLSDILDAPPTGPALQQVLNDAWTYGQPVMTLQVPANITSALSVPFLSFVPTCLGQAPTSTAAALTIIDKNSSVPNQVGSTVKCSLNAPGLFTGRLEK